MTRTLRLIGGETNMPVAVRKPRPKKPASPETDPRFRRVKDQLNQKTATVKKHPPAKLKAEESAKAAKAPPNEKQAGAKSNQVDEMKQAKTKEPDPNSFRAVLREAIDNVMPKNTKEAGDFMEGGKEGQMKEAVSGNVKQQKDSAAAELQGATDKPLKPEAVQGKKDEPIPADPATPAPPLNAGAGLPAPKPDADISQQDNKVDAEQQMKDADVTETQLRKANDPRFSAVLSAKGDVEKTADTSPDKYRAGEKALLTKATAQAQGTARTGMGSLVGVKNRSKTAVRSRQDAAKTRDEKRHQEVLDKIEGFYNEAKQAVDKNLNSLEADTFAIFDPGAAAAIANFKSQTNLEIEEFFDERYSGVRGKARWVIDKFRPAPARVKQIIQENLKHFNKAMDALIDRVASFVETRLSNAQKDIDAGQQRIKNYVKTLKGDLKTFGQEAEKKISARFEEMRQGVEAKKNDLAQKLAEKYKAAHDQANELAKKIEEENEGALYRFAKKLAEIVEMIVRFTKMMLSILKKAADVIGQIIADPIGFLDNLLAAIKLGVGNFKEHFRKHLEEGFAKWLFGSLASAGIELPSDFSLPSIFKLVLSVLGFTVANVRAEAVKLLGPTAVGVVEKLIEYIQVLWQGGPAALWAQVKEDLSNLQAMAIDTIKDWLITTIVKKAVIKLLSMFNPVGAFVQALLMIYNVVTFIIENAKAIADFISAVVDSVAAIAKGAISSAATAIEDSLAKAIPLVIGFLAKLIGLGGIGEKVREFITGAKEFVWGGIRKMLKRAIAFVKKGLDKLGGRDEKKVEADLTAALKAAQAVVNRFAGKKVGAVVLRPLLGAVKLRYRLASLDVIPRGDRWIVLGVINPKREAPTEARVETGTPETKPEEAVAAPKKEFDITVLKVGDVIRKRKPRGTADVKTRDPWIWFVAVITEINITQKSFRWKSTNTEVERTGVAYAKEHDVTWERGSIAQVKLSDEKMLEENKKEQWDDIIIARKVLNYRHHGAETNPPGTQWEHIIENSAGGAHSSTNLALTKSTINNKLGKWFEKPYASHDAPAGLPGTNGLELRDYLKGVKDRAIHLAWKVHAYNDLGLKLRSNSSERGRWMELTK